MTALVSTIAGAFVGGVWWLHRRHAERVEFRRLDEIARRVRAMIAEQAGHHD